MPLQLPRVSNDNPYAELLFRTLKYCPQWPSNGYASLEATRATLGLALHHTKQAASGRGCSPAGETGCGMPDRQRATFSEVAWQVARLIGDVMLNSELPEPEQKQPA